MRIGYAAISEEHPGSDLVANARLAAEAGFTYVSVSDHFHPWLDEQGHSPFAWSVLGAMAADLDVDLATAVTCPTTRYHPLVIAQAAATVAELGKGHFTLGVGSGEALNEHVVGEPWPAPQVRLAKLEEAVEVIRTAWEGDEFSHAGEHHVVDRARLHTLPRSTPGIVMAAGGPEAAELAGRLGVGLMATSVDKAVLDAYAEAGGGGPIYGQATCCWGPSDQEAADIFHRQWRHAFLGWTAKTDIPTPSGFAEASSLATPDTYADGVALGPDPSSLLDELDEFESAGFDHVAIHCVGPHQKEFIDWAGRTGLLG